MICLWRRIARTSLPISAVKQEININALRTLVCRNNRIAVSVPQNLPQKCVFHNVIRNKSKKAQHDSDDEDEVYDDDSSLSRDSKVVKFSTTSLRTDLILKQALGIARNKIEQQFYESKIRINGKKILKKSASVRVGDEIDIMKMVSPKNPDHLFIYRVEILNIAAKEDSIAVTARRFKNLLIENYEEDSVKGQAETETTSLTKQ